MRPRAAMGARCHALLRAQAKAHEREHVGARWIRAVSVDGNAHVSWRRERRRTPEGRERLIVVCPHQKHEDKQARENPERNGQKHPGRSHKWAQKSWDSHCFGLPLRSWTAALEFNPDPGR